MEINKEIYNKNYSEENVRLKPETAYDRNLIDLRFELIKKYGKDKDAVDLCCGSGSYLFPVYGNFKTVIAVDFSANMLSLLKGKFNGKVPDKVTILEENAESLSLRSESVDFLFSYTSLYYVQGLEKVLHEIQRILRPGGYAVIELGNSISLNRIVCKVMHRRAGWAKMYDVPISKSIGYINKENLKILKCHSFQIFPMYKASKLLLPLYPFLYEGWKRILGIKISGKMLDEWICSSLPFRPLAFRHIFELKKC
jgi:ubiquinone/menaquinone biosynthesis C-methylase UbiE